MRMRRLNDTDFASATVLAEEQQRKRLRGMLSTYAPYSLSPIRRHFTDVFNFQPPLFSGERVERTAWEVISLCVSKECKGEKEREQNLEVGALLYSFAEEKVELSKFLPYQSLTLGVDRHFWLPQYLAIDAVPVIAAIQPRGGVGWTPDARRMVFSAMNAGVRDLDSDLSEARLLIVQLPRGKNDRRLVQYWGDDVSLMSFDELQDKAAVTERVWAEVQIEYEHATRKSQSTGTGPLI